MFGLRKSQSKLEEFCVGLASDSFKRPLSDEDEEEPYAVAIALLLLQRAGELLVSIRNDQNLKSYCKHVNADLVALETVLYMHAMLSYAAMDDSYYEEEYSGVLNLALGAALVTIENLSNINNTEKLNLARNYAPEIQTATERFAIILEHSCFGSNPILKPSINLQNASIQTFASIRAHTAAFAQSQIPTCSEIVEDIVRESI